MNDAALKSFCIWARNELRQQVAQQTRAFGISEEGYVSASADSIDGRLLTNEQRSQRASLISSFLEGADYGYAERYEAMVEQVAYTWFNRLAAIRFMEVNDRLFSRVRMFSSAEGAFEPQVLKEALEVDIEGVNHAHVADLLAGGDDEALFRYLFLAQCSELAKYMPEVFEPIGSAMELLLPQNLLRHGSVAERMVCDIPEEDWREGVEIVGWMYQYYNAELKDEVFASFKKGKKADAAAMKPATQLFTPNWIVRYLVENSLGRLWMQGHPDSRLPESMPYYIPDDVEGDAATSSGLTPGHENHGDAAASSPECISVVDPACGSGHILVYAFELLGLTYEEAGYVRRDIPQLILQKNLSGIEIDPRAAQWTAFALYMKGCDYDSRFLKRDVHPNVTVLKAVSMEQEELALVPHLEDRTKLLDAMVHMGECGSLFVPEEADMVALKNAEAQLEERTDMFSDKALQKVRQMIANCEPLIRAYDIVVANPPYMGSSNMDKWLANWTKKNYPDSKRDLCTCFIERGFTMAKLSGYAAMVTMESWMFLSSFEKLRNRILKEHSIRSLVYMNHMVMRIAFNTSATVFQNGVPGLIGNYTKVEYADLNEEGNPLTFPIEKHGVYRRSANDFSAISGTPIAYWASDAMRQAFADGQMLSEIAIPCKGLTTGNNDLYLRMWWEVAESKSYYNCISSVDSVKSGCRWFPNNKGGDYRKWYGNNDFVVDWFADGASIRSFSGAVVRSSQYYFRPSITWSEISSGSIAFRFKPSGHISNSLGPSIFGDYADLCYLQGACNSTVMLKISNLLSPTLQFEVGRVAIYPILKSAEERDRIVFLVEGERTLAKEEYDSFETSWDFKRHPMV